MRMTYLFVAPAIVVGVVGAGVVNAPSAVADCTNAGNSTICSQGEVRGSNSGPGAGWQGPAYPSSCVNDWYCWDDDWVDVDVDWDPGRPGNSPIIPGPRGGGGRR